MTSCGPCTACCRIKAVDALDKPCGQACAHEGEGCAIYADRPQECADYECAWLISQRGKKPWPEKWRPDRVGLVVDTSPDRRPQINVDPRRPDAHLTGDGSRLCRSIAGTYGAVPVLHNAEPVDEVRGA